MPRTCVSHIKPSGSYLMPVAFSSALRRFALSVSAMCLTRSQTSNREAVVCLSNRAYSWESTCTKYGSTKYGHLPSTLRQMPHGTQALYPNKLNVFICCSQSATVSLVLQVMRRIPSWQWTAKPSRIVSTLPSPLKTRTINRTSIESVKETAF